MACVFQILSMKTIFSLKFFFTETSFLSIKFWNVRVIRPSRGYLSSILNKNCSLRSNFYYIFLLVELLLLDSICSPSELIFSFFSTVIIYFSFYFLKIFISSSKLFTDFHVCYFFSIYRTIFDSTIVTVYFSYFMNVVSFTSLCM